MLKGGGDLFEVGAPEEEQGEFGLYFEIGGDFFEGLLLGYFFEPRGFRAGPYYLLKWRGFFEGGGFSEADS